MFKGKTILFFLVQLVPCLPCSVLEVARSFKDMDRAESVESAICAVQQASDFIATLVTLWGILSQLYSEYRIARMNALQAIGHVGLSSEWTLCQKSCVDIHPEPIDTIFIFETNF